MLSLLRGVGGVPVTACILALGISGLSGSSARAQGVYGAGVGYVPPVMTGHHGAPLGYVYPGGNVPMYGPNYGTFGLGTPGFGLDYVGGCALRYHCRNYPGDLSLHHWGSDLCLKENLAPMMIDPYSGPAALGFWPPYSAPVAGTVPFGLPPR